MVGAYDSGFYIFKILLCDLVHSAMIFLRRPLDYINSPTGTKIAAVAQPGSLYGSFWYQTVCLGCCGHNIKTLNLIIMFSACTDTSVAYIECKSGPTYSRNILREAQPTLIWAIFSYREFFSLSKIQRAPGARTPKYAAMRRFIVSG